MSCTVHFWDMDHTIINNDCDVSWKEFMIFKGLAGEEARQKADFFYEQYKNECLDIDEFLRFQLDEFKGKTPAQMRVLCREHSETIVEPVIYLQAREMIREQQAKGDLVCLITATNRLIAEPVAELVGIEHILATELAIDNGVFTGAHSGVYCCGEGKLSHMEAFLKIHGGDLQNSSYFGDSGNDVVIMKNVGYPYATNPADKLRQEALKNGWEIYDFDND